MKLIDSSIHIIRQKDSLEGIYKQIERGARICYASESMGKTAKEFVDSLIKRGHLSPLEHGTVYLKIPIEEYEKNYKNKYFSQK